MSDLCPGTNVVQELYVVVQSGSQQIGGLVMEGNYLPGATINSSVTVDALSRDVFIVIDNTVMSSPLNQPSWKVLQTYVCLSIHLICFFLPPTLHPPSLSFSLFLSPLPLSLSLST